MIQYSSQGRFADDVFLIERSQITMMIDVLCKTDHYILVCGPKYSGKTFLLDNINSLKYNISRFNSSDILKQMAPFENLSSHKLYEAVSNLETVLVQELIEKDAYHLVKETRGMVPETRRVAMQVKQDITLIMMDAPLEILISRSALVDFHLSDAVKLVSIDKDRDMFKWPTKSEGFKKVLYVGVYSSDKEHDEMLAYFKKEIAL